MPKSETKIEDLSIWPNNFQSKFFTNVNFKVIDFNFEKKLTRNQSYIERIAMTTNAKNAAFNQSWKEEKVFPFQVKVIQQKSKCKIAFLETKNCYWDCSFRAALLTIVETTVIPTSLLRFLARLFSKCLTFRKKCKGVETNWNWSIFSVVQTLPITALKNNKSWFKCNNQKNHWNVKTNLSI